MPQGSRPAGRTARVQLIVQELFTGFHEQLTQAGGTTGAKLTGAFRAKTAGATVRHSTSDLLL
jgi:hypothetical protein